MANSYYTGSQRCEECRELSNDARPREIDGETVTLCGTCALTQILQQ